VGAPGQGSRCQHVRTFALPLLTPHPPFHSQAGSEESETSSSASTSGRNSNEGEAAAGGSSHRSEGGAVASTSSGKKQVKQVRFGVVQGLCCKHCCPRC